MKNIRDQNQTEIKEFLLLGFNAPHSVNNVLFFLFLVVYSMTLIGNILLIGLYLGDKHLHSPMYFFLSHLSICDILLSTSVAPILLCTFLSDGKTLTVAGCNAQSRVSGVITAVECFLLTVMSYDRYLAICNPLHYISNMSTMHCHHLVSWAWILGFLIALTVMIMISLLAFCGNNVIDFVYCEFTALVQASCSETFYVETVAIILSLPVIVLPFVFIISTYVSIFVAILRISSIKGREKAFSTCSAHLTVVCMYYGILTAKYTAPARGHSLIINKTISVLYTLGTPFLNPIIYSLRNQEIRRTLNKFIFRENIRWKVARLVNNNTCM
ncbi:olfactory receptor 477 [Xenopus laevis]|uniref:Olfactory receptor n=1 Tax=Xenopus laevis TaxID=8355 RepID=A0A8J0U9Y1_XENLA|nr:olfactory receptor 477 [Xenopus laevis]